MLPGFHFICMWLNYCLRTNCARVWYVYSIVPRPGQVNQLLRVCLLAFWREFDGVKNQNTRATRSR